MTRYDLIVHDPRDLKYFFLVATYLVLGLITANRLTGRPSIDGETPLLLMLGNLIFVPIGFAGFVRATRKGRFLTFDKSLWLVCSLGSYVLGAAVALFYQPR
ncbi:hypothetical protein BH10PLA1_BH10PLA1_20770 [soil metagenome]